MKRSSPECVRLGRPPTRRAELLARVDPETVIRVLEPFVTPARSERIQQVMAARIAAVTLVLDSPHDPHNAAAVLRSCDAFGVSRVHVVERHEPFVASNAVAKGTERWVEAITHCAASSAIAALHAGGHRLIGTHPAGELAPGDLAHVPRLALVLGNEHGGIAPDLAAACDGSVRVPMRGFVESLNLSVTAAILLCFATAGRTGDLPLSERRRWYAHGLFHSVPRARDILQASGVGLDEASGVGLDQRGE
jgi:tRNA (guanosine-2'-O-)-methyltransferase